MKAVRWLLKAMLDWLMGVKRGARGSHDTNDFFGGIDDADVDPPVEEHPLASYRNFTP